MINLNRAQILGNLTRDPEMRFTPNGQAVSNFSVATNRKWKNRDTGELDEATEYHDCVVWGKQAEAVSPMLSKGRPVFVEGRLQTRSWEGQDGVKRYRTEIVADNVIVLGSRGGGKNTETTSNPVEEVAEGKSKNKDEKKEMPKDKNEEEEINIEDIPF